MKIVAVLSSTVINVSGVYEVKVGVPMPDVKGLPSYVGHPDTAKLLEHLEVVPQPKGALFSGLEPGDSFLAVPLANPDRSAGWTVDQALVGIESLRVTLVTRVK